MVRKGIVEAIRREGFDGISNSSSDSSVAVVVDSKAKIYN